MCGHVHADALDVGGDYPELFGELFSPFDVELVVYDAVEGALPVSIDECDGWLTSPSRASVGDDDPWIAELADLILELVAHERPFAGMCFGHQLLAVALGGRVERAPVGWGAGVKSYDVIESRPWMDPPLERFRLIASHEDQVAELPSGAVVLASAGYCPVAAFEIGARAIGIQAHPEFTIDLSRRLTTLRYDLMGAETSNAALASLDVADAPDAALDRATVARWIANFLLSVGD